MGAYYTCSTFNAMEIEAMGLTTSISLDKSHFTKEYYFKDLMHHGFFPEEQAEILAHYQAMLVQTTTSVFDKPKYVQDFTDAGFTEEQIKILAHYHVLIMNILKSRCQPDPTE